MYLVVRDGRAWQSDTVQADAKGPFAYFNLMLEVICLVVINVCPVPSAFAEYEGSAGWARNRDLQRDGTPPVEQFRPHVRR